nr:hypothetical protein [Tanacetum cinerariifolium]
MAEAKQISYGLTEIAKEVEARENIELVQEAMLDQEQPIRIPIPALQEQLYTTIKDSPQAQGVDPDMLVVLGERIHDYQLGIKSYQMKINHTTLTIIIPGIEILEPYTIITDPFIRIAYKNSKNEKKVMDIEELPEFCDATLKKVLMNILDYTEARYGYKYPPLSEEDKEVMELFKEEIQECLKHRRKMRRWEIMSLKTISTAQRSSRIINP